MFTTLSMLWGNVSVLLEGVPEGTDLGHVKKQLQAIPGVTGVHDLHIWSMSTGSPILTAHMNASVPQEALAKAHTVCIKNGIAHATIQIVPNGMKCTSGLCCK